jgi:hypothetical protein
MAPAASKPSKQMGHLSGGLCRAVTASGTGGAGGAGGAGTVDTAAAGGYPAGLLAGCVVGGAVAWAFTSRRCQRLAGWISWALLVLASDMAPCEPTKKTLQLWEFYELC